MVHYQEVYRPSRVRYSIPLDRSLYTKKAWTDRTAKLTMMMILASATRRLRIPAGATTLLSMRILMITHPRLSNTKENKFLSCYSCNEVQQTAYSRGIHIFVIHFVYHGSLQRRPRRIQISTAARDDSANSNWSILPFIAERT